MISATEQTGNSAHRQTFRPCGIGLPLTVPRSIPGCVDLCSGMGGLSLAAKHLGFEILAGVDLNSHAIKTFAKNFPAAKAIEGSVRSEKILSECKRVLDAAKAAGRPTVVLSGPPCQGFSMAGSRNPSDPRNQILVAVGRAVAKLQPDFALIENVSMLLAERYEERIEKFEETLSKGGYQTTQISLLASDYGVPQKRKRAFFLVTKCHLDKDAFLQQLANFKTDIVSAKQALAGLATPIVRPDDYDDDLDYGSPPNHIAMQHSERVKKKIALIEPGKGPMSYRRLHPTKPANTLFSGHRAPPAHFSEPRSITVREAARLQGFPDSFRVYGTFAKQMEQVTNAVPPPLTEAVLQVLLKLNGSSKLTTQYG